MKNSRKILCILAILALVVVLNGVIYLAMLPGKSDSRPSDLRSKRSEEPSELVSAMLCNENPEERPPTFVEWTVFEAVRGEGVKVQEDLPADVRALEGQRIQIVGSFFKIKRATTEDSVSEGIVMPVRFRTCCGGGATCSTRIESMIHVEFGDHPLRKSEGKGIVDAVGTLELLKEDALGCLYSLTRARVFPRSERDRR